MHPLLNKLTIAIPVYNDARYLSEALQSSIQQAAKVVVYDNASTDGTAQIAEDYASRYDHVHHVRHAENIGAFDNFKAGLDACTTEYFCWVGSHDRLSDPYSIPLLEALELNKRAVLAAGTILHMDEEGKLTGQVTRSRWANRAHDNSPLERAGAAARGLRRDCSIFYGIYRAEALRRVWYSEPFLGFDRAMLVRLSALGEIEYVPHVSFYARNLDKSRDSKTDRERRANIVGRARKLQKNNTLRNKRMVETMLENAHTPEEMSRAFFFIDKINRRYQSRRHYQRRRWLMLIVSIMLISAFVWALLT